MKIVLMVSKAQQWSFTGTPVFLGMLCTNPIVMCLAYA